MSNFFSALKIFIAMGIAYLFVISFGTRLFERNSPKINMQYIASLRELPSKAKVTIASIGSIFSKKSTDTQIEEFKQKTGAIEVAIPDEEKKTLITTTGKTENPVPNAVFNYISQGVAAAQPSEGSGTVLRIDPKTNIEYKRYQRKDGTFIDIMILK
jgi:hypothetical protein